MKCPLCNVEAYIKASRYVVEGDKSEDQQTKLFLEQDMVCLNPNCNNFEKVIHTFKNPINLG